ncbi:MAG: hypothetical protein HY280_04575 [Nitrospinae bacterium]|nr:hypothetical protein [Nitrospinota bacterium]
MLKTFLFSLAVLLAACGQPPTQVSNCNTSGPTGPTTANGYMFTLTVCPSTISAGSSITASVTVTKAGVNPTTSVSVNVVAPGVAGTGTTTPGTTDVVTVTFAPNTTAGKTGTVTASVDGSSAYTSFNVQP